MLENSARRQTSRPNMEDCWVNLVKYQWYRTRGWRKFQRYRKVEVLCCVDGRANSLMNRNVVGALSFGVVAMVAEVSSPTIAGGSVV